MLIETSVDSLRMQFDTPNKIQFLTDWWGIIYNPSDCVGYAATWKKTVRQILDGVALECGEKVVARTRKLISTRLLDVPCFLISMPLEQGDGFQIGIFNLDYMPIGGESNSSIIQRTKRKVFLLTD